MGALSPDAARLFPPRRVAWTARGLGALSPDAGAPFPPVANGPGSQRLGRTLPGCGAPFPSAASGSGSQGLGRPLPGCGAPFPSATSGPGSQRLVHTLPGCGAPFPSMAPVCAAESGLRKSLDRNRGPVCCVGEGGFSGAEFAPFPSPLPPASGGDGPVCCQLALLWNCSVPLFCELLAVCSSWLIFPCSPTV